MQHQFSGLDAIQVDIANCYGLDKEDWPTRMLWTEIHKDELDKFIPDAEESLLYEKAIHAYKQMRQGFSIGHNVFLDATASGLQIMAALSGCKKTAHHVNMIDTGKREDVYIEVAGLMNNELDPLQYVDRPKVKKPVMTHYYNKSKQDTLTDDQKQAFYHVLAHSFEGAEAVKDVTNDYWDSTAMAHSWTLPDGHIAKVLVTDIATARIEVDELDHTTFAYRFESNQPSTTKTSLVPNIIHSIDGYIVREMIRRAKKAGFELAHIFDCFTCHPNYAGQVMQMYREIMAEIADMDLLADILSEISGTQVILQKYSTDLSKDILASSYMLS